MLLPQMFQKMIVRFFQKIIYRFYSGGFDNGVF